MPFPRRFLACLLALVVATTAAGQSRDASGPRAVRYDELGRIVRSLRGKVVVVYFWSFG